MAVEVADELQYMGIGTALVARVLDRARANRFTLLTATMLWETGQRARCCGAWGFRARASHGAEIELELELEPATGCSGPAHIHAHPTSPGARDRLNAT